jgi:periplasmic divalent cation tolerance protein
MDVQCPTAEIVMLSTVNSMKTAAKIARVLVEERQAACVNIVPGIRSIYRWEGKVCDEMELLLIIKTTQARFEAARQRIRSLHPYQLPESIALPIVAGDQEYLAWLSANVGETPPDDRSI